MGTGWLGTAAVSRLTSLQLVDLGSGRCEQRGKVEWSLRVQGWVGWVGGMGCVRTVYDEPEGLLD